HRKKLHAADKQCYRQHHQWAVFRHDGLVQIKLFVSQETGEQGTKAHPGHAEQTKKLERPRRIIQQKFDDNQVQENPDGAPDSVIGLSALAMKILDGHFRDSRAGRTCQRRDEPVELAVKLNFLNDLAAVGLKRGSKIVKVDSRKFRHHPVGGAAGKLAHQPVIPPVVTPAAHQFETFFDFFQKARNFFRVVLQIAVHRNDDFAARKIKTRFQRWGLPEIPPQPHQVYAPVVLEDVRKNFERIVLAAVVHKHQFVRFADPVHHFGKLHVESWDVFLFIEERNDNGILDGRIASHSLARYLFYASW